MDMLKGRKVVTKEEPASNQSLDIRQVTSFEKPKILLVDCDDEVETMLRSEGFNVRSGTFGRPYKKEKEDGYTPVIASFDLPNYMEQEVVVIDLSPPEAAPGPEGDKHVPNSEDDWWVKCNRGVVSPRPRAMAGVRADFDRILKTGGVFIVFACARDHQDLVIAKFSPYSRGFEIQRPIDYTNWSFLTILDDLFAGEEEGDEIHVDDKGSTVGRILSEFSRDAAFQCALGLKRGAKQDWNILEFKSLAKNKYGQPVSASIIDPRNRGLVLIFPQLSSKGQFLVRLMKEILPELSPHLFPHVTGSKWVHRPEYELTEVLDLNAQKADIAERAARETNEVDEQIQQVRSLSDVASLSISLGLKREKLGVQPAACNQLRVRAVLDDRPVFKNDYSIRHPYGREAVRDNHRHSSCHQFRESNEDFVFGPGIERRGWLVQDQHLRVTHVSSCERDLLPFATRQLNALIEAPAEHLLVALCKFRQER